MRGGIVRFCRPQFVPRAFSVHITIVNRLSHKMREIETDTTAQATIKSAASGGGSVVHNRAFFLSLGRRLWTLNQSFGDIAYIFRLHLSAKYDSGRIATMTKEQIQACILEIGVVPGVRLSSADEALFAAEAVCIAGIPIVEVTMTVPGAVDVIAKLIQSNSGLIVGAGTVFDMETARRCLGAGVKFLTSTGLDLEIVELAFKENVLVFPGVLTPTEVHAAAKAGCQLVKVFPCSQVGGPGYIRVLKAPFPNVSMIAAGGVTQQNAAEFIRAGAVAIGVGQDLIPQKAIDLRESDWIQELARRFVTIVKDARAHF